MKRNISCRYGLDCRRRQFQTCYFTHPQQPKEHKKHQNANEKSQSRQRQRTRQLQRHGKHKSNQQIKKRDDYPRRLIQEKHNERVRILSKEYDLRLPRDLTKQKQSEQVLVKSQKTTYNVKRPHQQKFAKFCKSYHLNNRCNIKCDKIHAFLFKDYEVIKRKLFHINHKLTKSTKFHHSIHPSAIQYILKHQKELTFYQYFPPTNEFKEINTSISKNHKHYKKEYFQGKGSILYFSFFNQLTNSYNIKYYDLKTSLCFQAKNSHVKEITGFTHISQESVISVALDGMIKIWDLDKEKFTLEYNNSRSKEFKKFCNPEEKNLQLYFVQKIHIGDGQFICIGSQGSKLLIFSNKTPTSFKEIKVSQTQYKILMIKRLMHKPFLFLVLAVSKAKSCIFKVDIRTSGFKQHQVVVQFQNQAEKRINTFESHKDLLVVSYDTELIFYSLSTGGILGGIFHRSAIKTLAISTYRHQQTEASYNVMTVIEGQDIEAKKAGVFSVYFIK